MGMIMITYVFYMKILIQYVRDFIADYIFKCNMLKFKDNLLYFPLILKYSKQNITKTKRMKNA